MSSAARRRGLAGPGLALATLHLLLGLLLYDPTLFPGGDNAGYMILGDALVSGEGYRDLYLPDQPLHTKYPPLYPILLALLTPLGGVQLFKFASLGLTTLAVWLTYRLAVERIGRGAALVAAGMFAVSPVLLDYSHYVLSEALFVALVLAALLWSQRDASAPSVEQAPGAWFSWSLLLGLAAAGGAFLTRTAGLPLLAALVLFYLLERRSPAATAAGLLSVATAGGWWLYQRLATSAPGVAPRLSYLQEMLLRNPYDPAAGTAGPTDLLIRSTENAWTYISDVLPRSLAGGTAASAPDLVHPALGLAVAAVAFLGWVDRSTSRLGPAELFTVLYAAMLVIWPTVWTDQRFLLPLLPLILLYAVGGAVRAGRWLSRRREGGPGPTIAAGILAALVGVAAVGDAAGRIPDRIRCLAAYRAGDACDPPEFASFYDAAEWARANTAGDAIFVNRKPRIFYWLSGRRGDLYPYSTDAAVVMRAIERLGADYVVVDAISGTTSRYLVPAVRENLPRFRLVYEGGEPPTFVLRFDPEPAAAD